MGWGVGKEPPGNSLEGSGVGSYYCSSGTPSPMFHRTHDFLAIAVLTVVAAACTGTLAAGTGTLVQPARIDLRSDGRVVGFMNVPPGTRVEVLGSTAGEYQVRRNPGETPFMVPADALRISEPVATPSPQGTPTPSPSPVAATPTPSPSATPSPGKTEPTAAEVNKALGIPLFGAGSLWEENDAMVANRLRWPQESKTSREAGYRRYPYTFNSETRVFGVRALCLFLQGVEDKTARVSILFANKGDIAFYMSSEEAAGRDLNEPVQVSEGMLRGLKEGIRSDAQTLRKGLRDLFGPARIVSLGRFQQIREQAERWDWKGHAFLLVELPDEYVVLRIVPKAVLDDADSSRKAFAAARQDLPRRVEKRPNGDVLIGDIPMIDQGRKGYCVPATFERLLRYYGLPADMNVLAMAGKTQAGGGTSIGQIVAAMQGVVYDAGGIITPRNFSGSIGEIRPLIDAGKPLIFAHYSTEEFNKRINGRMERRVAVNNWNDWATKLLPALKKGQPLKPDPRYGHVCLIIGYNDKTREIAITDSWGPAATERWMTEEEARQIMQPTGLSVIE
jgi:hypothetical protein